MTPLHRVLLATALIAACVPSAAAAQTSSASLPSQCHDQKVAPVSVVLTCGDGGFIAEDLVGSGWGGGWGAAGGLSARASCGAGGGAIGPRRVELHRSTVATRIARLAAATSIPSRWSP